MISIIYYDQTPSAFDAVVHEMNETMYAGVKISMLVDSDCLTSELTRVVSVRSSGFPISSLVTIQGPRGAKVSMLLPLNHCFSLNCASRSVTSLRQV